MNNEHTRAALARDEHVAIPVVALEDLPAVAAALSAAAPSEGRIHISQMSGIIVIGIIAAGEIPSWATAAAQLESRCTCPSGDGSLRWPCPMHPPTSPQPEPKPGAQSASDDSIRLAWALPLLTGSADATADRRALALALALQNGLEGIEAIDVAIAATSPELVQQHGGDSA